MKGSSHVKKSKNFCLFLASQFWGFWEFFERCNFGCFALIFWLFSQTNFVNSQVSFSKNLRRKTSGRIIFRMIRPSAVFIAAVPRLICIKIRRNPLSIVQQPSDSEKAPFLEFLPVRLSIFSKITEKLLIFLVFVLTF